MFPTISSWLSGFLHTETKAAQILRKLKINTDAIIDTKDGYLLLEYYQDACGIVNESGKVTILKGPNLDAQIRAYLQKIDSKIQLKDVAYGDVAEAWQSEQLANFKAKLASKSDIEAADHKVIFHDREIKKIKSFSGADRDLKLDLYLKWAFKFGDPALDIEAEQKDSSTALNVLVGGLAATSVIGGSNVLRNISRASASAAAGTAVASWAAMNVQGAAAAELPLLFQKKFVYDGLSTAPIDFTKTSDGGYAFTGRLTGEFPAVLKVNSSLDVLWAKKLSGLGLGAPYGTQIRQIKQTQDGGVIIVGGFGSFGAGAMDAFIFKLKNDGSKDWIKAIGTTGEDSLLDLVELNGGGYILVGGIPSKALVIKLNSAGIKVWEKCFGDAGNNAFTSISATSDGGFLLGAQIRGFGTRQHYGAVKLDEFGSVVWAKQYGISTIDEYGGQLVPTADGGFISSGYIVDGGGKYDGRIMKVDSNQNIVWVKGFGTSGVRDDINTVVALSDGGVLVSAVVQDNNVMIFKLDQNGNKVWSKIAATPIYYLGQDTDNKYLGFGPNAAWDAWVLSKFDDPGVIKGTCIFQNTTWDALYNVTFTSADYTVSWIDPGLTYTDGNSIVTISDIACIGSMLCINTKPVVNTALQAQVSCCGASIGQPYSFTFAADTFVDADGDTMTYSATLANGDPLPGWLNFAPLTRVFSGTTTNLADIGNLALNVTATDPDLHSAADTFTVAIAQSLVATNTATAINYTEDTPYSVTPIVVTTPSSTANITLTLSNPLAGRLSVATSGAVTSTYDSVNGIWNATGNKVNVNTLLAGLKYQPALNYNAAFSLAVNIVDGYGQTLTSSIGATGAAVNDIPTITPISKSGVEDGTAVAFTVGEFTSHFADFDIGDSLVSVQITSLPANGTLRRSGMPVTLNEVIAVGNLANLTFQPTDNWNGNTNFTWRAYDGKAYSADSTVDLTITAVADAPIVNMALQSQASCCAAGVGQPYSFIFAPNTFTDADGDTLTYNATLADNSPLPSWLNFTPSTRTFSGTPASNADIGNLVLKVAATDPSMASVADTFTLAVAKSLSATNAAAAINYIEDTQYSITPIVITTPSSTVTVSLTLSNPAAGSLLTGTSGGVTSTYDAVSGIWSVTGNTANINTLLAGLKYKPADNYNSAFSIAVSIADSYGQTLSSTISATGTPVNDCPTVTNPLQGQVGCCNVKAGDAYNMTLAANTFSDVEGGELTYNALLANDTALPSWLKFFAGTKKFSGVPTQVGSLDLKVTATDPGNCVVADTFTLVVADPNNLPTVSSSSKDCTENTALVFSAADFAGQFHDVDAGDELKIIKITALPNYGTLKFNGATVSSLIPVTEVTVTELNAGALTYIPKDGSLEPDNFKWKGFDGRGYSTSAATLSIKISKTAIDEVTSTGATIGAIAGAVGGVATAAGGIFALYRKFWAKPVELAKHYAFAETLRIRLGLVEAQGFNQASEESSDVGSAYLKMTREFTATLAGKGFALVKLTFNKDDNGYEFVGKLAKEIKKIAGTKEIAIDALETILHDTKLQDSAINMYNEVIVKYNQLAIERYLRVLLNVVTDNSLSSVATSGGKSTTTGTPAPVDPYSKLMQDFVKGLTADSFDIKTLEFRGEENKVASSGYKFAQSLAEEIKTKLSVGRGITNTSLTVKKLEPILMEESFKELALEKYEEAKRYMAELEVEDDINAGASSRCCFGSMSH